MMSQFSGHRFGWLLVAVAVTSIVAGAGVTAGVYEAEKASNRSRLALLGDELMALVEEQADDYEACGDHVRVLVEAMSTLADANFAKDDAVDVFFNRYDYYAGDAEHLYDALDQQNRDILDIAKGLPASPC